jgi:hypothetical protein
MTFARSSLLAGMFASALVGCATTNQGFRVADQTYSSREQAAVAARQRNLRAEESIKAAGAPILSRKMLVVVPTPAAFSGWFEAKVVKQGKRYAQVGTSARSQDDLNAQLLTENLKSVAASIRRANLYQSVEVTEVDTTATNVQPTVDKDVLSFYATSDSTGLTPYFHSAKYGKQVVPSDVSTSDPVMRRQSFINEIKAKALQ